MINFISQLTPDQEHQRQKLLQESMRSDNLYDIALEYPIVFSKPEFSVTGILDDQPIIHANMFFREFSKSSSQNFKVGLIGNVATLERYRGQGFQRKLFSYLEQKALQEHADALILWSDLVTFYQKLGFREFGSEIRFQWSAGGLAGYPPLELLYLTAAPIPENELSSLMAMRPDSILTLNRSAGEFQTLLSIPETMLIKGFDPNKNLKAWAITGKGADMKGVFHEWGARTPRDLTRLFSSISQSAGGAEFMILSPQKLDADWFQALKCGSPNFTLHPMALIKQLSTNEVPEDLFIWGLDSI